MLEDGRGGATGATGRATTGLIVGVIWTVAVIPEADPIGMTSTLPTSMMFGSVMLFVAMIASGVTWNCRAIKFNISPGCTTYVTGVGVGVGGVNVAVGRNVAVGNAVRVGRGVYVGFGVKVGCGVHVGACVGATATGVGV